MCEYLCIYELMFPIMYCTNYMDRLHIIPTSSRTDHRDGKILSVSVVVLVMVRLPVCPPLTTIITIAVLESAATTMISGLYSFSFFAIPEMVPEREVFGQMTCPEA